jgi:membrane protein DedA with SNARE-associated domain
VRDHEALIILASRFLPGLRTAIPAACAFAGVPRAKYSVLNLISAFAWAGAIMLFVKFGAQTMGAVGLNAWWGPFIPAGLLILFVVWLSRPPRTAVPSSTVPKSPGGGRAG